MNYNEKIAAVEDTIANIFTEFLRLSEREDASQVPHLDTYSLNSIDALEVLLRVEKEFGIEIADEDLNADLLTNQHSLAAYVVRCLAETQRNE